MIGNPITIPAISIRHLTRRTRKWLAARIGDLLFMAADHDNGFFLTLPMEDSYKDCPSDLVDLAKAYAADPPAFGWILLDVDGDVVPGLPVYD